MSNTHKTAQEALDYLRARAKEHEESRDEAYQEYAAGIRDAITALEPFLDLDEPPLVSKTPVITVLQEAIDALVPGVQVGVTVNLPQRQRAWIQPGGIGGGGKVKMISLEVLEALVAGGHIVRLEHSAAHPVYARAGDVPS